MADITTTALEEEMSFYDYGMSLAGGSSVKQELVLQNLTQISAANNRRITRSLP